MMFENMKPFLMRAEASFGGMSAAAALRDAARGPDAMRFVGAPGSGAGDALRAMEWGELTARLNAARDLRMLLRNEAQAPIEAVAAIFGDAAARYFALIENDEPGVNPDALGEAKWVCATSANSDANKPGKAPGCQSDAAGGAARDMK
jgi:hypothetical protein